MGGYRKIGRAVGRGGSACGGFTLLELMVVLVIVSLMAAFVLPRVGGNLDGLKLKAEAKKVAAALRYARSEAVSENRTLRVGVDAAGRQMTVSPSTDETAAPYPWDEGAKRSAPAEKWVLTLPEGIALALKYNGNPPDDGQPPEILFYPSGGTGGAATVLLRAGKKQVRLTVDDISGEVRIEEDVPSGVG